MNLNIELTEFPSVLHSHIYSKWRGIMPLSYAIDSVKDPSLRKSCLTLHGFIEAMLSDMYDNPELYHFPMMKLEEFYGEKLLVEMKRQFPKEFKKILSQTGNAVPSYFNLLCKIGVNGILKGNDFVVSEESLKEIKKQSKSSTSPVSFEKRMEALKRVGFVMEVLDSGEVCFTSKKHIEIFPALQALADKHNFSMLDFRNIDSKYNPTYEDYFISLIDGQRELAYELHNFTKDYKMRVSLNANWGVNYHYKSKHVMCIGTGNDFERLLSVTVIGKERSDDHTIIDRSLAKETQDFKEQVFKHLTGCDANQCLNCSTYSSGNYVTVLGKRHQMCGGGIIGYAWRVPALSDIEMVKRLIKIRCEIINESH